MDGVGGSRVAHPDPRDAGVAGRGGGHRIGGVRSDAMESGVNLIAALVVRWAVRVGGRPSDAEHQFGHAKAEEPSAA